MKHDPLEAGEQTIKIAGGLLKTPNVRCVSRHVDEIEFSERRKAVLAHRVALPVTSARLGIRWKSPVSSTRCRDTAVEACLDGGAESVKRGLIFPFVRFQRVQTGAKDLAGVGVLATSDLDVDELVQFGGEIDLSSWHLGKPHRKGTADWQCDRRASSAGSGTRSDLSRSALKAG